MLIYVAMTWHMVLILFLLFWVPFSEAKTYQSDGQDFRVNVFVERSDVIWGFDFLPDGKIIFTERSGEIFVYYPKSKKTQNIKGAPKVVVRGQGGLLDVRVHPHFSSNSLVYLTYSEPVDGNATTALSVAKLSGNRLVDFKRLFSAWEPNSNSIHFGSRIEFDGKGHLFLSVGDRNVRERAQSLEFHLGKILRLKEDGTVPSDNPFVNRKGAKPEIWSYGHRNPQGLVRHPINGEIWSAEFGPRGGDEINLIKPGANYGWPVITYGREYYGPKIGEGTRKKGMEQPLIHYVPSISPSGMSFYFGDKFPKWKGNLFLANLSDTHLRRLVLNGHKVIRQEELLRDIGWRFRHVRQGPDGYIYFSTDNGRLAALVPASP